MAKKARILVTGGGTGGHIYPLVEVVKKLRQLAARQGTDADIRYFGAPGAFQFLIEQAGISVSRIASSKWRRYGSLLNFLDFFKFFWALAQSWWKLFWFMPDVTFSKGGPGALPLLIFCRFYRIPVVLHESDTIPSLTTKLSLRFAQKIYLAFQTAADHINRPVEIEVAGNPTREEFFKPQNSEATKMQFGLSPREPVILFLGGSQGSERINDFVLNNINAILANRWQVLHQIGRINYAAFAKELEFVSKEWGENLKKRYVAAPYFEKNLVDAMAAADIIVSRAGAGSVFEIAALGKPAILIPLPEAAQDHQTQNAYVYAKAGTAIAIEEENLLPHLFINQVEKLLKEPGNMAKMSQAAKAFATPQAAEAIASGIFKYLNI